MSFLEKLHRSFEQGLLPEKYYGLLHQFYLSYKETLESHRMQIASYESIFDTFLQLVERQIRSPFAFEPYHKQVLAPFNHYQFGLDFVGPLIDLEHSSVTGLKFLEEIEEKMKKQENVIFLSNHQIEADPQVISILLKDKHPKLAQNLIFVAGERVITDPLAAPFSMGHNLLCIYSKKYIDHPPELKTTKQLHNKKTMDLMSRLLCDGGCCIWVAPSGGRDRADASGAVHVAPFDPQSIEMFYLMTQKASRPTSFYPLALYSYDLLPPPQGIQKELGEKRITKRGGAHLAIGPAIPMEQIPGLQEADKRRRREIRSEFIWSEVNKEYRKFPLSPL